jgi:hypothetical protein
MRVCIEKSTGKLVESQAHATEGTMIQNALQYGYLESDLEEKEVTQEEYIALLESQPMPVHRQISLLKAKLAETDYAVIKIAEGAATFEEYADIIAHRQAWRAEINQLELSVD